VLDHQTWLEHHGSSASEREADRLSVWLQNAGYDPAAALTWMRRMGPRYQVLFIASPITEAGKPACATWPPRSPR
jgi:predicted Zn-dependent protease